MLPISLDYPVAFGDIVSTHVNLFAGAGLEAVWNGFNHRGRCQRESAL